MFELHVVQAEFGDCLILKYGTAQQPRYMLVDGGPEGTFDRHLRGELQTIATAGGRLERVILSHVDTDHITGLLDLLATLGAEQADGTAPTIAIDGLWHNSFIRTLGSGNDVEPRLRALLASAGAAACTMASSGMALLGIGDGDTLRRKALALVPPIPINAGFANDLVSVDDAPGPLRFANLSLRVVGPTHDSLEQLRGEWLAWLAAHEDAVATGDPRAAAMADRSTPNLSSIMILAEADKKRLLLTGDGRGDHLLAGLAQASLVDPGGSIHVDVLKLPHHGSDRNVTKSFFKKVTADTYVASTNGRDGNPDLATLIWLVEAAKQQKRRATIVVTNETESTAKLVVEYPPAKYGYKLKTMDPAAHSVAVPLA